MDFESMSKWLVMIERQIQTRITSPMNKEVVTIEVLETLMQVPEIRERLTEKEIAKHADIIASGIKVGEIKALNFVLDWLKNEIPED